MADKEGRLWSTTVMFLLGMNAVGAVVFWAWQLWIVHWSQTAQTVVFLLCLALGMVALWVFTVKMERLP